MNGSAYIMHDCIAERGCTAEVWMLNEDTKMNHFMAAITQLLGIGEVEHMAQLGRGKRWKITSFEVEVWEQSTYLGSL